MSWIDDGTAPDWSTIAGPDGFVDVEDFNDFIRQYLLDLAARVADIGWTEFTFNPGATNWGPALSGDVVTPPAWKKVGSLVFFSGAVQRSVDTAPSTSWNGANVFTVLPGGARPVTPWLQVCANSQLNDSQMEMKVDTDGGVQFRNTGSVAFPATDNIFICTVFPAG